MQQPQKRVLPAHLANPVPRSSQIPGWSTTHTFTSEDVPAALQKLFIMAEAHADHISNLQIEAGMMNTSVNLVSSHAFHNVNVMVNQLKDETSRQFLRQQAELNAKTPGSDTVQLHADHVNDMFALRTNLSTYNDELQAKLAAVDMAQQNSFAALQILATEAANEIGTLRGQTNEANLKVAAKFSELESALEELRKQTTSGSARNQANTQQPQKEPERPRFVDPVTGKCEWTETLQAQAADFGPSSRQEQADGWQNWYMDSPQKTYPMREPPGSRPQEQPQDQYQWQSPPAAHRQNPGTINITPYSKVFEEKLPP